MPEESKNNGFWDIMKDGKSFMIMIVIIVLFILITSTILAPIITKSGIGDKDLVITFIGVLATFIVIGNFAQVSEIRHNMERDLDKAKAEITTSKTNIKDLKKAIETLQENLPKQNDDLKNEITKLDNAIKQQKDGIELSIKNSSDADKLFAREEIDKVRNSFFDYRMLSLALAFTNYGEMEKVLLLFKKLLYAPEKNVYLITIQNGQSITATAQKVEEGIEFFDKDQQVIDHSAIKTVDGFEMSYESLSILLEMYGDLRKQNTNQEYSGKKDIPTEDSKKSDDDTDETSFKANDNIKNPES